MFKTTIDTTFPHFYECEQPKEMPTGLPHYYYPGASLQGGHDGVLIEIRPVRDHQPWLGTFAFGQITPKGVTGIFTTPDPHRLCVVSTGEGYFVNARTPTEWERIVAIPIIDVRPIRAHGILVFANFTELFAYSATGVKWRTKRLTWDNLKITEVTDTTLRSEFWDIRDEKTASFVVDLETGTHQGGVSEI